MELADCYVGQKIQYKPSLAPPFEFEVSEIHPSPQTNAAYPVYGVWLSGPNVQPGAPVLFTPANLKDCYPLGPAVPATKDITFEEFEHQLNASKR